MPDDKRPPVFIPITLEPGGIIEPAAPVAEPVPDDLDDMLADDSPSSRVINANLAEQTRGALSSLTPDEEKILRMRFGIGPALADVEGNADAEVGQDFEVTRQRIREIEAKALRKLRERQAPAEPGDDDDD